MCVERKAASWAMVVRTPFSETTVHPSDPATVGDTAALWEGREGGRQQKILSVPNSVSKVCKLINSPPHLHCREIRSRSVEPST